jgi:hypothetical protein
VKRKNKQGGTSESYFCLGKRKDPVGNKLGDYSLKKGTSASEKKIFNDEMCAFVTSLNSLSRPCMLNMKSFPRFNSARDRYTIPPIFDQAGDFGPPTAAAVGLKYWSVVHVDDDYYYATLSCQSPIEGDSSILFYFAFPSYGIAVPMRSGSVLVFNPTVFHCCTNPMKVGVTFCSRYISAKICNTQNCTKSALKFLN